MKLYGILLLAFFAPAALAQDDGEITERLEPPSEEEWVEIQERVPLVAPATVEPTMTIYDVHDLVVSILSPMPSRLEAGLEPEEERLAIEGRDQAVLDEGERLADLLRAFVEPELSGQESIGVAKPGGYLLARLRQPQHQWLQDVLNRMRGGPRHHEVRARFLEGPRGAFREHLTPGTASFLDDAEARARFLALSEQPGFELVSAPELIVRDVQRGHLAVLNQVPYVAKYELVVVQPGAEEIADPQIEILNEGYSLDLRVLPLAEDVLGLDFALTRAWIERPIPTRKIRLSAAIDSEVTVSSPTSHQTDVRSRLLLPRGASVVFVTPSNTEGRDLAIVVSVSSTVAIGLPR